MDNFFDKSLHYLGKKQKETVAINVGAMDGVLFDEMIGYTNMYGYKVLYVEPIPYLFDKLKNNIKSPALFENSAISDYEGEIEMVMIDQSAIDEGLVHSCFYGMSAVYPPKNGLGSEFDRNTVESYGRKITVPCITFDTLIKKHEFNNFDIIKVDAEGHDCVIFKQIDFEKYSPKVIRLEWINLSEDEKDFIKKTFEDNNFVYEITSQDIVGIPKSFYNELKNHYGLENPKAEIVVPLTSTKIEEKSNSKITLVTGLWDIKRSELTEGWNRSFDHYLSKLDQLLKVDCNMVIFGDESVESFVKTRRKNEDTLFIKRDLSWFRNNDYYDKIQKIRNKPDWFNQVGWLKDSTQAKLEMYNPLVMSKVFLLHDAKILDKFDSEYMFWIDAGLTNTVHPGYFTHDKVLDKLPKYISKFSFVCFPYDTNSEIHGFEINKLNSYADAKVNKVARGGFFGGPKESISKINSIYYGILVSTLNEGYMGTEESIFSIMTYKHSDVINYFEIEGNGLMGKFFEDIKNDTLVVKSETTKSSENNLDTNKVGLYVISFNSPEQFETLIISMLEYDKDFILKTKKFLLDNSTDLSTTPKYKELCEEYGFEHIKKDNIGIVGGRVFVAEHFNKTDLDLYFWFEDDMSFHPKKGEVCRNGFNRFVPNLYQKILSIMKQENFDFLKLNFTEFYGDNGVQWSWYNLPQDKRKELFPEKSSLPIQGLDPNAPRTKFNSIKTYQGLSYITGEIYLCNWPIVLTKEGNYKCYIETQWAHPFEQTLMSYCYQETVKGRINSGLLLLTPTEHHRFHHYEGSLRKES